MSEEESEDIITPKGRGKNMLPSKKRRYLIDDYSDCSDSDDEYTLKKEPKQEEEPMQEEDLPIKTYKKSRYFSKMSTCYSSIEEIREKYKDYIDGWKRSYAEESIYNTDDDDKLLLCIVASEGDFEAVKYLIEEEDVDPNYDYYYKIPLIYAVREGNFKIVRYLIEKCACWAGDKTGNKYYGDNYPALAFAYKPKIAKYLINHGADEIIPAVLANTLYLYGIEKQVEEFTMKLLKEAIDKRIENEKKEDWLYRKSDDDDKESNGYVIEFKDEETAKRMYDELIPKYAINEIYDNTIEIWDEEIDEAKFQEIADKYKVEFFVSYQTIDIFRDCEEKDTKEFIPK